MPAGVDVGAPAASAAATAGVTWAIVDARADRDAVVVGALARAATAGLSAGCTTWASCGPPVTSAPVASTAAVLDVAPVENADAGTLLPAGFSLQDAQSDAIAIAGGRSATNLDRGLLNDRLQAINLGQFDPATGQFAPGFGPAGDQGFGGFGGSQSRRRTGRAWLWSGGPGGPGGRGFGPGGRGGFLLGGRGARAQNPYQGSATYTFGGSALDSPPYQLRPDVPVTQPSFTQNSVGGTIGGPLKIPGLYKDTNRRTNFQINYTGNHSSNLFDQYATVPTDAMRAGDFSASPVVLIDPATGQPFSGNQIPSNRIDPSAASLLAFIPSPNLPGNVQNYHTSTTTGTSVRRHQSSAHPEPFVGVESSSDAAVLAAAALADAGSAGEVAVLAVAHRRRAGQMSCSTRNSNTDEMIRKRSTCFPVSAARRRTRASRHRLGEYRSRPDDSKRQRERRAFRCCDDEWIFRP